MIRENSEKSDNPEAKILTVNTRTNRRMKELKLMSEHTSSWKNIDLNKLKDIELIEEINREDLKSSSSAETILIKDKMVMPDANKLKEFVDNRYEIIERDYQKTKKVDVIKFNQNLG